MLADGIQTRGDSFPTSGLGYGDQPSVLIPRCLPSFSEFSALRPHSADDCAAVPILEIAGGLGSNLQISSPGSLFKRAGWVIVEGSPQVSVA